MPASLMVFADITRRRLEAASLKRSEERYRHVVNNLNEGMIVIQGNRVVFNIQGNAYRLVVKIHYDRGYVYVRFVGSHAEYDKIDAETV